MLERCHELWNNIIANNNTWNSLISHQIKRSYCKWIFRIRYKSGGSIDRYKARLVAKGYTQQVGVDYIETFSPIVKVITSRVLLTFTAANKRNLQQVEINYAFLHGDLDETIYMQPSQRFHASSTSKVCKSKNLYMVLNKLAANGIPKSPTLFLTKVLLKQLGIKVSSQKKKLSLFHRTVNLCWWYHTNRIKSVQELTTIKEYLNIKFSIKDLGNLHYFAGLEILQTTSEIHFIRNML